MNNKINWLNLSVEFITVLIGILIAFQLNRCSVENSQKQTVSNHIQNIIDETKYNQYTISEGIKNAKENKLKLDSLIGLVKSQDDLNKINDLSIELLNFGGVYFKTNAYNSIVESGDIRFMKNFKLKTEIIFLYEHYKWVDSVFQIGYDSFTKLYLAYINENFDLLNGTIQKKEIYYSKKFRNSLGSYRFFLKWRIERYNECYKKINTFLSLIEAQNN